MRSGMFGWDLPPGCTMNDIDPPIGPCAVCGKSEDECVCPECPKCGGVGDPTCYGENGHGLKRTLAQQIGAAEHELAILRDRVAEQAEYVEMLKQRTEAVAE